MSFWGWIIGVVATLAFAIYIEKKKWPNLVKLVADTAVSIIVVFLCYAYFPSTPSFTGDIKKDGKIVSERIKEGEDFDEVMDDLIMYYVEEKGYGMHDIKELIKDLDIDIKY
mgnify:FL=1